MDKEKNCFNCQKAKVECNNVRCEHGKTPTWINCLKDCKRCNNNLEETYGQEDNEVHS